MGFVFWENWAISPEVDGKEVVIGLVTVYTGGKMVEVLDGKVGWGNWCEES
jgi:hypothetical protein